MKHLKLVSISAKNLKGASFELTIKPATFMVGENYVGKTARADAITLALVGYLPELGKTNEATFGLSSGKDMSVLAKFQDEDGNELKISRRWFLSGDSIKSEKKIPPELDCIDLFATMLKAESWFGLTETQRVDWVFRNVSTETDLSADQIMAKLGAKVDEELPDVEAKVAQGFLDKLSKRVKTTEQANGPLNNPEFVAVLMENAEALKKVSKDHADQMNKTTGGVAALRASEEIPVNLSDGQANIGTINGTISSLKDKRAGMKAKADIQKTNNARREKLKSELARLPGLNTLLSQLQSDVGVLKQEADKMKAQLDALPSEDAEVMKERRADERTASDALATHRADLKSVIDGIDRNENELGNLLSQTVCPYCGAEGEGWKEKKSAEIISTVNGLNAKKNQLTEHIAKVSDTVNSLRVRIQGSETNTAAKNKLFEACQTADGKLSTRVLEQQACEREIAGFSQKTGELNAIPEFDPALEAEISQLDADISAQNTELAKWESEKTRGLGRQNDIKRLAEAEKARTEAKEEESVAKVVVNEIKEIKAKMVADAFASILETANIFCSGLLKSPVAFNPEKSEVGRYENGIWIGHKTFSGVEKLLCYAGIQVAFATRAPVRVMILDEMLRAKGVVFDRLVSACKAAVKLGIVDNFVGILPGEAEAYAGLVKEEDEGCVVVAIS